MFVCVWGGVGWGGVGWGKGMEARSGKINLFFIAYLQKSITRSLDLRY